MLFDGVALFITMAGRTAFVSAGFDMAAEAGTMTVALMEGHESALFVLAATHGGMATL